MLEEAKTGGKSTCKEETKEEENTDKKLVTEQGCWMKKEVENPLKTPRRRNSRNGRAEPSWLRCSQSTAAPPDQGEKNIPTSPGHRTQRAQFLCPISLCSRLYLSLQLCVKHKNIQYTGMEVSIQHRNYCQRITSWFRFHLGRSH